MTYKFKGPMTLQQFVEITANQTVTGKQAFDQITLAAIIAKARKLIEGGTK
jgi:hypothetical protein